ncbi:MAG: hypothetical protein A3D44_00175 [Candidatus Staskawiczbacteria bacterium RIFCSPHIGHO2_02_FULL_42_22]|uniref:Uncharacterized protein n=1 Tax=Candidatus Staskawiczbacteria bacterium RIFCSPHIGHO2_02_FULL_42_22 TaxID=1802207 RepID=A0A1G2I4J6_9BACT|nr:MAG: hypothetical protein A3D44_00175 [Candidatus Staskawiczbacteria bacterium RIFCSPHIGHO2_02_FULL_42_22]
MNINIVNNKYINALLLLLLFSAVAHVAILLYAFLMSGDFSLINYFNILDLAYLFDNFFNGVTNDIFATIFVVVLYVIILKFSQHE